MTYAFLLFYTDRKAETERYWTGEFGAKTHHYKTGKPSSTIYTARARLFDTYAEAIACASNYPDLNYWRVGRRPIVDKCVTIKPDGLDCLSASDFGHDEMLRNAIGGISTGMENNERADLLGRWRGLDNLENPTE